MTSTTSHGPEKRGLVHFAGALGMAACFIGMGAFLASCFGFSASLWLSPIPLAFGLIGFFMAVVGANTQKHLHVADSVVFASIFMNILGVMGGLMMMSAWLGWQTFAK